ncbi:threonine aldolase family protein [Bacillus stercoris]|uniref:GntG family PLP-dependent aldolase n=1 Tax=Bacillus stercoris TaxID=2054641 RepID=A0ABU0VAN7_9BACI|nr:GntG family PLP-dependent aldolase [Bacillus stercoris]KFF55387.1 threonine aldolase [Bacillus subtilis] [Bacillus stercoris]MDQ1854004.1 GntG family PLP-dependent aldolase [Bacillus stercoris]
MIDMRSDTLTKPSEQMREVMRTAIVGDDCYGEDVSVNNLEEYCKELFEVEAALFVPSGTMANQIAIKAQVEEGNEILTEANYHINFYESASTAILSRAVLNCVRKSDGIINKSDVQELINSKPRGPLYSKPQLVTIENTINYYQGKTFPLETIKDLYNYTRNIGISLHMDGARLFNAHIATGIPLNEYARNVDTLSVCFAKGLGAPFGSMLMGSEKFINSARSIRKQFGGGLHQIGMYASAAQYALDYHLIQIKKDHQLTKEMAIMLNEIPKIAIDIDSIETNMIFINIKSLTSNVSEFIKLCEDKGLLIFPWLPGIVRIVINRHISREDIYKATEIIDIVVNKLSGRVVHA